MANNMFPGAEVVAYGMIETSYGTPRKPTGADAVIPIDISFTPTQERAPRDDRTGSSDFLESVEGRYSATWEMTKYLVPNGAAGTKPDDTHFLQAGLGNLSSGGTCVEYSLATAHTTSLTIRRGVRANASDTGDYQDHVMGAIVNRVEFGWGSQGRNGLATVSYGGPAKKWGFTGNSTLQANIKTMGTGGLFASARSGLQFSDGAVFTIAKATAAWDTSGGSGALVTYANATTGRLTVSTIFGATHSGSDVLKPYNPTAVTSGSPIHGKLGWVSLDSSLTQVRHLGGKITLEDNRDLLMDEVGQDSASDVLRKGKRNVTFTMDFYLRKTEVGTILGKAQRGTNVPVQVQVGNLSGKSVRFRMRNCETNIVAPDIPDNDMAKVTLTGQAYGVNGNDSLRVQIV